MTRFLFHCALVLFLPLVAAAQIDLTKPLARSLSPDILYFDFDEESMGFVTDHGPHGLQVEIVEGVAGEPPNQIASRGDGFGKAMEFHYGSLDALSEELNPNDYHKGNHLLIQSDPVLDLVDTSFTMGAWVQVPEAGGDELLRWKHILSKGGYRDIYPGWGFYIRHDASVQGWFLQLALSGENEDEWVLVAARLYNLAPGLWCHVAASYDRDAGEVILYENGIPIHTATAAVHIAPSQYNLTVGERGTSTHNNLPIVLDEVFITSGVREFLPAH